MIANGPDNPVVGFLRDHDLYEVASWETDPIAVVREPGADRRGGEVLWVDITSDPSFTVSPLAADFATFMAKGDADMGAVMKAAGLTK